MLRNEMGDSIFQKFIRTFYDRFKGKNADTNDLEKTAEELTNKDWNQFFKQWLYTPGIPQLDIHWKSDEQEKTVSITVTQVQSQFVFQFPLQIKLEGKQGLEIKTLNITKQSETFSIPVNAPTRAITADPNTLLLFDSRIENISP
jgi:aminopeptidase N